MQFIKKWALEENSANDFLPTDVKDATIVELKKTEVTILVTLNDMSTVKVKYRLKKYFKDNDLSALANLVNSYTHLNPAAFVISVEQICDKV